MAISSTRYFFALVPVMCDTDDGTDIAKAANSLWERLQAASRHTFDDTVHRFNVPTILRGTTICPMLKLADDIPEFTSNIEGLLHRIARHITDFEKNAGSKCEVLTAEGLPVDAYMARFMWDDRKYPVTESSDAIFASIKSEVTKIDSQMQVNAQYFTTVNNKLQELQRNQTRSLTVRNLSQLITSDDMVFSEKLTTLLVVVPRQSQKEWLSSYEFIDVNFVVARSSHMLYVDEHEALYTVTLFAHVASEFKLRAQEKGFIIRDDYTLEVLQAEQQEISKLISEKEAIVQSLYVGYSQVVSCLIHLCALHVFVEGYLRYGPRFLSFMGLSTTRNESRLTEMFADFAGSSSIGREPMYFVVKLSRSTAI